MTRQKFVTVPEALREIKARPDGFLYIMVGSVLLDVDLRFAHPESWCDELERCSPEVSS